MNSIERKEIRYLRRKEKRHRIFLERITPYNDSSKVSNLDSLYYSYKDSRKNIRWKKRVQQFGMNILTEISNRSARLEMGDNVCDGFTEFQVRERGKIRDIQSPTFGERVIQKDFCDNVLTGLLTRSLIYDSGASIKGKGVKFVRDRLCHHLERFYKENGFSNEGYYLSIDFKSYFNSIHHKTLLDMTRKYFTNKSLFKLYSDFVNAFKGEYGLGLGSQISQNSALIYPSEIAHALNRKGVKHIVWYMDDVIVIHKDKDFLKECLKIINNLGSELHLTLNPKKTFIAPIRNGIVFLKGKYFLKENGAIKKYPLSETVQRKIRKLKRLRNLLDKDKITPRDCYDSFVCMLADMNYYNSYNQRQKFIKHYNDLFVYPYKGEKNYG